MFEKARQGFWHWVPDLLVGMVFIAAACLKILDLESFYVQVSYYGIVREPFLVKSVAVLSLVLETLLGMLLVFGVCLRVARYASFGLLVFFSSVILYAWFFNDLKDCGCFGNLISMSPLVSVGKNVVLATLLVPPLVFPTGSEPPSKEPQSLGNATRKGVRTAIGAVSVVAIMFSGYQGLLAQVPDSQTEGPTMESAPEARIENPDAPYAKFRFNVEGELWDLGEGEYLVALLSDSCDHCASAVPNLNEFPLYYPSAPPIVGICLGEEESLSRFRQENHVEFPTFLVEPLTFFSLIGSAPPRFAYVRDGKVIQSWDEEFPKDEEIIPLLVEKN